MAGGCSLAGRVADTAGVDCSGLEAAIRPATEAIRSTIADHLRSEEPLTLTAVTITDAVGSVLSRISLAGALQAILPSALRLYATDAPYDMGRLM
ncbi:DUF6894 family protein [Neorhizobium galegae]|uniref:DUF6894 family protein n=1 Tax=Neorhizobium galegae TaxID=399 RepID=UPI0006274BE7